jgi:hypothetical protein
MSLRRLTFSEISALGKTFNTSKKFAAARNFFAVDLGYGELIYRRLMK